MRILASTTPTAVAVASEIAASLGVNARHSSGLNPLDRGEEKWRVSADDDERKLDFHQRYSGGGESYEDMVGRLEPCLLDIEAAVDPVLVIAHVWPLRALRAYFLRRDLTLTLQDPKSDGARVLANRAQCVVELKPRLGGDFLEIIHDLSQSE